MTPRLKILTSSGSKKGTQIYYPFLSKSPGKRISSRFPKGAPMERDTRLQGIFTYILIYLINISFGVSSKGTLLPGPPHGVPSERDAPFLDPSFIHVDSPFYNMPEVKFIHISDRTEHYRKHMYYFISKKKTKKKHDALQHRCF